ncbi:Pr6Pr family membrane protein [Nesterenkonia sp. HG001]|uniref:Pr6Pr family membrane protein n=1 Tax=Nesterenkonia sp. HG001 TaxID=2983207 RepID=UPI002AC7B794|nr:Pr6Pr family membrane protein [Nesterenkonia sp. HG001]MDZ5079066.1 Pr6Pr family membrane protein [Nesterenkonia sp. HG001]
MAEAEAIPSRAATRDQAAPPSATIWAVLRVGVAVLGAAAVIAHFDSSVSAAVELKRDIGTTIGNFFSYFTILSNSAAAVFLIWAGLRHLLQGRRIREDPPALAIGLACVTSCTLITGAVYNTLLRHLPLPQGTEPPDWSNEVLHLVVPLFLFADLLLGPRRRALPWRSLWVVVGFPLVWAIYTMVRGPLVTNPESGAPYWYPYPFLDPHDPGLAPIAGYPGVMIHVIGIAVAMIAVSALVIWWGRRAPGL